MNFGTTIRGAKDDLPKVHEILTAKKEEVGEERMDFAIHMDGAFYGPLLNLISPYKEWKASRLFDTLSISLYKLIGAPYPSGVCLIELDKYKKLNSNGKVMLEHINFMDSFTNPVRKGTVYVEVLRKLVEDLQLDKDESIFEKILYKQMEMN